MRSTLLTSIIVLLYCIFVLPMSVFASTGTSIDQTKIPISITVNDKYIYSDVKPFLQDGTTFVPIRFISEALCIDSVEWDQENKMVIIKEGDKVIKLYINQDIALVNGKATSFTEGVKLVGNRTFVPIRFISETLGSNVSWEPRTLTAQIYKNGINVPRDFIYDRGYTDDDLYWLSRIVESEASGESMNGKIGVANVILNRIKSDDFPDTVWSVIFDDDFGIQFEPVSNGAIYNTSSIDSIIAAKLALEGTNVVGDSVYFLNPQIATNSWIVYNRDYYSTIGKHVFYL